ncbi:uncharacterized protein VSU04_001631 isoform 2-T2 [Chlamydotis macqueenii]
MKPLRPEDYSKLVTYWNTPLAFSQDGAVALPNRRIFFFFQSFSSAGVLILSRAVGAAGHAEQVDTKQRLYPAGSSILWSFLLRRCLRSQLAVRRREEERVEERSGPGRVSWEMRFCITEFFSSAASY